MISCDQKQEKRILNKRHNKKTSRPANIFKLETDKATSSPSTISASK